MTRAGAALRLTFAALVLTIAGAAIALGGGRPAAAQTATTAKTTPTTAAPATTNTTTNTTANATANTNTSTNGPTITVAPIDPVVTPTVSTPTNGGVKVSVTSPNGTNNPVLIVVLVTLASFLPGLLMVATTFPRFLIVLGLTRQALGLSTTPPNQVLTGLAAFLTLFAMAPVFGKMNDVALQPALKGTKTQAQAVKDGWEPLRDFMLDHTRRQDLDLFEGIANEKPATPQKVSPRVLIPAYIISELRAAFTIGFLVWVPFLLIDLIVASVLSAMGMLMMPPVVISLPVKLIIFVLVDGWALLVGSLLRSVA